LIRTILFTLLSLNLFALEVSVQGAKENYELYSTLHIKDKNSFLCQEITNDFDEVVKIVCAFSKAPSQKLKTLQNDFFKIKSEIKKKTFFIIITPYKKMKLYPIIFNLSVDDTIFQADVKLSKHWMIVGYKDKLPLIKNEKRSDVAINFPFLLSRDKLPHVGGLDLEGKPVHIKRVGDVSNYLKIKEYYKEKKYDKCLELIDEVIFEYPSSLFMAEFLYYKIKVYTKLGDAENVIDYSRTYLREYSSDESVPEVLSLTAKAYSYVGQNTDANYFFDRLFSEHHDSVFTKWGYIYKGEMLEESGASSKAVKFYKKALHETNNIDVAATAAFRLAHYTLTNTEQKDEAAEYAMKIIKAKPGFFVEYFKKSQEMMFSFVDEGQYLVAAAIAKALLDEIDSRNDFHETLLKDRGIWLSKTSKKQEALAALNKYISEYRDGLFETEVKIAKDSLFFDVSDANVTTKIATFNELIQEYGGDSIGNKAIYEKAKLLLDNKMYTDVLGFKESLLSLDIEKYPDTKTIVIDCAVGAMKVALEHKECHSVLSISDEYKITLSNDWDDGIYECAMKGGDYALAKKTADKNLKSKDIDFRKKWLYRYIEIDFATGNYSEVIEASKELILLIKDEKKSQYKNVYRLLFDTYQRLENSAEMIKTMSDLESVYGDNYKDIERYIAVMAIGSNKNDDNLIIKYGSKVVNIQKSSSSYAQSPFVEFALYQAYINKEDYTKALEIIKSLDNAELSKSDRARQKYLLGSVNSKLWRDEEAQKAYQESIDADAESAWAKLAKSAKDI